MRLDLKLKVTPFSKTCYFFTLGILTHDIKFRVCGHFECFMCEQRAKTLKDRRKKTGFFFCLAAFMYRPVARSENPGGLVVLWWA